jgi:hypothetical protein
MALPGDDAPPVSTYGIRIRITPDQSGGNPWQAETVLYRSTSAGGTYSEVARGRGTQVWFYDDILPLSEPRQYYKVRTEMTFGYTESAYIGPVDAKPSNLDIA